MTEVTGRPGLRITGPNDAAALMKLKQRLAVTGLLFFSIYFDG